MFLSIESAVAWLVATLRVRAGGKAHRFECDRLWNFYNMYVCMRTYACMYIRVNSTVVKSPKITKTV